MIILLKSGVLHDSSFSSIMSTTRNNFLDDLTLSHSLGASPTSRKISKVKLKFGELRDDKGIESNPRAAFGLEESTLSLKKGKMIY
jgi:hypothetical protein